MKWTCSVCGYVHEGPEAPDFCPQCKAPKEKFVEVKEGAREWADQHVVGVAKGVDPEILQGLRENFTEKVLGVFHTHPYDSGEGATQGGL